MDIDEDGHVDIISGSYSRMDQDMAGLFQVLYGTSGGTFKKAAPLNGSDGKPLILPGSREKNMTQKICTRQFVVDWDGDGKLDLVTGNIEGGFFWFKGEGKGKFHPKAEAINQDGKALRLPTNAHHSDPFVVDFDGDGDLDLMSGATDAGVYLAENTAGKGKAPALKAFKAVIFPVGKDWARGTGKALRENDVKRPTYGCRIWVEDVNGDGKLDVLVGDSVTLAYPKKGLSDAEMEKKHAEWQKEFEAAQAAFMSARNNPKPTAKKAKAADTSNRTTVQALAGLFEAIGNLVAEDQTAMKKAQEEYSKVYQKRSEFMTEEMTGFVWLYLQK